MSNVECRGPSFRQRHALISLLERGELDIALTRYTESDTLQSLALYPTHIVAVLHREHPLARRRSIDVDALSGESLLMPPAPFTSRTLFDAACRERGLRPRVALESDDERAGGARERGVWRGGCPVFGCS
jgi:DNA-binding transcriptional LysR family regulator